MELKRELMQGGGEKAIAEQHQNGKQTARERIAALLDEGSFMEMDTFVRSRCGTEAPCEGVVTGFGTVDARSVCVIAEDFTVMGGSMSEAHAKKICKVLDMAVKTGVPVVTLADTAGARVQEGLLAMDAYAQVMSRAAKASGMIPQITVVCGPCPGAAAVTAQLSDFVVIVDKIGGIFGRTPQVVSAVTGTQVDFEGLGGAMTSNEKNATAHLYAVDEATAMAQVKALLGYLPSNCAEDAPCEDCADDLNRQTPQLAAYAAGQGDIHDVIASVVDNGQFLEILPYYALNMVTALARINGRTVGIVANNPADRGGVINGAAADKGARMVSLCDAFNIPVVTIVDTPGLITCEHAEHKGLVRHAARLAYAYGEATVPKLTLIAGNAIGTGYALMGSKALGMDLIYAWPSAQVAAMEAAGAATIAYEEEIAKADDPIAARAAYTEKFLAEQAAALKAAQLGLVDDVVEPELTRPILAAALELLWSKQEELPVKKHGVMPM